MPQLCYNSKSQTAQEMLQGVSHLAKFPDGHNDYEPDKTEMFYLAFSVVREIPISFQYKEFRERGLNMDLLKGNLKKLYLRFLIPSLGSAMVMSIYTLTDAIVIGKGVGPGALAALSITTPLLCIL